jgi:hypothetical protein
MPTLGKNGALYRGGNEGDPLAVSVYFANHQPAPPLPNDKYRGLIVRGARHWQLPDWYIQELEQIEVAP